MTHDRPSAGAPDDHEVVPDDLEPFLRFTRNNYRKPLPAYMARELKQYVG